MLKLNRFGLCSGLAAAAFGILGCSSSEPAGNGDTDRSASVGFHLLASGGVSLTSASYALQTEAGASVVDGSIPVPADESALSVGVENLGAGDYVIAFSASGVYQGHAVPCSSAPTHFHLNASQQLTLPTLTLTCSVTNQVDTTGGVNADIAVTVQTITVGSLVQTFTYAPRSVGGVNAAGQCVFPPIALTVAAVGPGVSYAWSASPDGSFGGSATDGTYECASGGTKTLTLTGTDGTITSMKSVAVNCDDTTCAGGVCGDGIIESGEQCDSNEPHCVNCRIAVNCGDGIVDPPEQCDSINLPTATCDLNCHLIGSGGECGDGNIDPGEQCDNGALNSDTTPNACRTSCKRASCGDGVVDTGEACDTSGPSATCSAQCTDIGVPPPVGCVNCLRASAEASFQEAFCDVDPKCLTTEACVADTLCMTPDALFCYCGKNSAGIVDATACRAPAYVPTGPCHEAIAAGITGTGATPTNAEVEDGMFDYAQPSGVAMILIDATTPGGDATECAPACVGGIHDPVPPVCGNGLIESGEQCDSTHLPTATCDIDCQLIARVPMCGDGFLDAGEQCDTVPATQRCQNCVVVPTCGDGIVDAPEECDSVSLPTPTCDTECHVHLGTCAACLNTSVEADFQASFCNTTSECLATEACIAASHCYSPDPLFCYCGPNSAGIVDMMACRAEAYIPTGPCHAEIAAGIHGAGATPTNAEIQDQYFDYNDPSGVALLLINSTAPGGDATACASTCL